jgi:hypothetical protein
MPISDKFFCPITKQIMASPVKFVNDPHCYEKEAILQWLAQINFRTPLGIPIEISLTEDFELKKTIDKFLNENPKYRSKVYISNQFIIEVNQALKAYDLVKIEQLVKSNNNILFHKFIDSEENQSYEGNTIIHVACYEAEIETLRLYLTILNSMGTAAKFSALLIPGLYNYNAVHCVCKSGSEEAIDLIIDAFNDKKDELIRAILATDSIGQNALFMACEQLNDEYNDDPNQVYNILKKLIYILGDEAKTAALATDDRQMNAYKLVEARLDLYSYIEQCLADMNTNPHQGSTIFFTSDRKQPRSEDDHDNAAPSKKVCQSP